MHPRPVDLFVDEHDPSVKEEVISSGVSYNVLGVLPPDVEPIPHPAVGLFGRHQPAQVDLKAAVARLRQRTLVNRAEAILIKQRRLSELDAYKWLRRQSMSRRRRISAVAGELEREIEGSAG